MIPRCVIHLYRIGLIELGIGLIELGIGLMELGIGLRILTLGAPSWPVYPALFKLAFPVHFTCLRGCNFKKEEKCQKQRIQHVGI